MPLLLLTLLTLVVLAAVFLPPAWRRHRREKIQQQPFPAAWRHILKQRMPYFRALPADLQLQLKKLIQVFVAEKQFVGCAGLTVTDEMKVTIAAQACLLLLNKPAHYYPKLQQILIYPAAFVVPAQQSDAAGVVSESAQLRLGESWQTGQIVLSWVDTLHSAAICNDGHNLVIHEFAHQLDQLKGQATGAPLLRSTEAYQEWSQVLSREFEQLQRQLAQGLPTLFDAYAATNPAEFFAVISEVFFEQPDLFAAQHPALYQQLRSFYALDPLSWVHTHPASHH
ncbi:zinc-dependent peptidase [Rheinheimera soli]|uniref:Mlc titration factor MtfA (PtsG expression regulator) n=1 Tax=Rheinheimera soli TaxID=443616 RepID=A0ABU1VTU1_9GAMM|nr:zinc-dependent peptidase [Rheinheimera soli]MDR7119137.1 Mlc titration factor MtfA (ptsG expression regulator) [Rheinheimera soli]